MRSSSFPPVHSNLTSAADAHSGMDDFVQEIKVLSTSDTVAPRVRGVRPILDRLHTSSGSLPKETSFRPFYDIKENIAGFYLIND